MLSVQMNIYFMELPYPHTFFPNTLKLANKKTQYVQSLYFTSLSLKSSAFDHLSFLLTVVQSTSQNYWCVPAVAGVLL
jgi:hypothetical protein